MEGRFEARPAPTGHPNTKNTKKGKVTVNVLCHTAGLYVSTFAVWKVPTTPLEAISTAVSVGSHIFVLTERRMGQLLSHDTILRTSVAESRMVILSGAIAASVLFQCPEPAVAQCPVGLIMGVVQTPHNWGSSIIMELLYLQKKDSISNLEELLLSGVAT
jgi:hypothetical protein